MRVRGPIPEPPANNNHLDSVKAGPLVLDPERIDAAVAGYGAEDFVSDELLQLTRQTLFLMRRFTDTFAAAAKVYDLPADAAKARLGDGQSLLEAGRLVLDAETLVELAQACVQLPTIAQKPIHRRLARWVAQVAGEAGRLDKMVRANVPRDRRAIAKDAATWEVPREMYMYLFHHLGATVLTPFAGQLAPLVDDAAWQRGTCPICGNTAALGGLVGDGAVVHLMCEVCNFVWTFPRHRCAFCGNQKRQELKTLITDHQSPYQLDVCDKCRFYLKTVDFRRVEPDRAILLPVEDAATIFLNVRAGEAGYRRE